MEFQYNEYIVRITLNPVDIIVRFEHATTFRAYEQTFFERDFPEANLLGGLEFLGKALIFAFKQERAGGDVCIEDLKNNKTSITFNLVINNPLFVNAIMFPIELQALRKESGNVDVSVLNRKVKEMSDGFEPRLLKLQQALETRLAAVDTLTSKLKEMEERSGNHIVIPGCMFAIPTNLTTLTLVKDRTALPSGDCYSMSWVNSKYKYMCNSHGSCGLNYDNPQGGCNSFQKTAATNIFIFDSLTSLKNLKYMKSCQTLTLSGTNQLQDYSALGEMVGLTHLSIVSSRNFQNNNYGTGGINGGNNPILTDIKWIRNLKNLQSLTLLGCTSLSDITPLKDLPGLRELDIRETGVRNTDFLINPNLKITK